MDPFHTSIVSEKFSNIETNSVRNLLVYFNFILRIFKSRKAYLNYILRGEMQSEKELF